MYRSVYHFYCLYTHGGIPYDYVIPLWVYLCQQQNMYNHSYIIKIQVNTGSIEIILFMHSLITQMHEQLFIYIFTN